MNRNKVAFLALSSTLLAAVVPAAHAGLDFDFDCGEHNTVCLADSYGTNILLTLDRHWKDYDYGSLFGFLEVPPGVTGYTNPLPCPIKGSYVLDSEETWPIAWFTTYIESGCFCADGGNPAFRVATVRVNRSTGVAVQIDDLSANALRCDGASQALGGGQIGPYPSSVDPFPTITPDWAGVDPT